MNTTAKVLKVSESGDSIFVNVKKNKFDMTGISGYCSNPDKKAVGDILEDFPGLRPSAARQTDAEVFTIDMDLKGVFAGNTLPGWLLILWIIIMGTIVPYLFVIAGLRLLSASTSSVIGMLEPVLAGVFAWIWLEQSWNGIQLIGAAVVLVGIYIADRARSVAA